ncbi:MAG: hypothetical protein KJ626_14365 [Verrucomicrobia bacterium]|nr:hypothetical protein [Verrucomicrobiota bacterium]
MAKGYNGGGGYTNGSYVGGYIGQLTPVLEQRGWGVTNVSTPGDNTSKAYTNIFNKLIPANPDYAVVALSLANQGLVFSSDREATLESFRSGLTNILHTITTNGIQPVAVTLVYPSQAYTLDMYDYVKRMNLIINSWDIPSINLMGSQNDEQGRWVYEYINDPYHPTADGHAEFFYTVVPTLFDAIRVGKTNRPSLPPTGRFMRVTQESDQPAPLVYEPEYTMHSFTANFQVRTTGTGTVAAIRSSYTEPLVLIDFGPTNDALGRATASPDAYGNHWNSWRPDSLSAGTASNNLIDVAGAPTAIDIAITSAFSSASGRSSGFGLFQPEGPDPELLGSLAVETATEDYFRLTSSAGLTLSGLDTGTVYTLRIFACRESSVMKRTTDFQVTDRNGSTTYSMLTSGANTGRDGAYDGNNHRAIGFQDLYPKTNGTLLVSLSTTNEGFISLMEIGRSTPVPTNIYGTVEVRDSSLAYVSPGGVEITAPVDVNDGAFQDISLSHNFALQRTYLFVNGLLYGTVGERLVPDRFVLGGSDQADASAAPTQADYQAWCLYRSSWTPGEAMAQHLGALQQASLEVAAPLDDGAFALDDPVTNVAQSMASAYVRGTNVEVGIGPTPPSSLTARSYDTDSIELSWNNNAGGGLGTELHRRTAGTQWNLAADLGAGVAAFTDTGLDAGEEYIYRVAAKDGALLSGFSTSITASVGADGSSYEEWMSDYIPGDLRTWLIDFNSTVSTNYGGAVWNTLSSWTDATPRALVDTGGVTAARASIALIDPFDTSRSGNGSPLSTNDYAADAQSTLFVSTEYLDDQLDAGKASIRLSGLRRSLKYNVTIFARRGTVVSGFDYRSRYEVESLNGNSAAEVDTATNENTVMFADLSPDADGNITLSIGPADKPNGAIFAGISLMKVSEVPRVTNDFYLVDFAAADGTTYDDPGYVWNSIPTNMPESMATNLTNELGDDSDGYTLIFDKKFNQYRSGSGSVAGGYDDVAEDTCFALGSVTTYAAKMTFGGLNTNSLYDFLFLARRPNFSSFSNLGSYSFEGSGEPVTVVVDGRENEGYTFVGPITPDAGGEISLSVSNMPTALIPFAVLNVLRMSERTGAAGGEATRGVSGDADADGNSNLKEYIYNMNPLVTDAVLSGFEPILTQSGPSQVSLWYDRYLPASDVAYEVQSRTNLLAGVWETATGLTETVVNDNRTVRSLRLDHAIADEKDELYLRLRMDYAP